MAALEASRYHNVCTLPQKLISTSIKLSCKPTYTHNKIMLTLADRAVATYVVVSLITRTLKTSCSVSAVLRTSAVLFGALINVCNQRTDSIRDSR